jgi:glycosyltransferase involved in cell wall biosynthesis
MSKPSLSVICATYNGASKLPGLLDCLSANLLDNPDLAEIIFVIDGSTDKSEELIGEFIDNHRSTRVIAKKSETNFGISQARNIGLAEARSEIIAFVDDDCRPSQSWIEEVISLWGTASQKIVGIGGVVSSYKPVTFNQRYCGAVTPLRPYPLKVGSSTIPSRLRYYYTKAPDVYSHAEYLVGCCMTFRKYSLDRVHGFDPLMKFGGDDQYICGKLRREYGEKVLVIDPRLVMPHEFSRKFVDSLRRSYSYGKASGRHGRQIRTIPSINPGPIITCFLVGAGLATRQMLALRISIMLCALVLFFFEMLIYNFLLVKQKIIVTKSISKKFLFSLAFFFCEILNCYGFIAGFIRDNETLVNRYE